MIGIKRGFWLGSALAISAACCDAWAAQAQVFKCVDPDGHVVFSDTDCGSKAEKVEIVESSAGLSQIKDSGLTAQEKAALGAIEKRDAQIAGQRAAGGGSGGSKSAPAAASPPPSTAPKSSY